MAWSSKRSRPRYQDRAADGTVKLSAYGIEQPSQFGVHTLDDVKLHLDFTVRPVNVSTARLGGSR